MPRFADHVIGQAANEPVEADRRYAELETLMQKSPAERMEYWKNEFARCVKCYACRAACPLCYCERCIVDKNRPTVIDTSATLKGNFAWHIVRAFHLAGRCIGCEQCVRVCPAGIDLRLLNSLPRGLFAYRRHGSAGRTDHRKHATGSEDSSDERHHFARARSPDHAWLGQTGLGPCGQARPDAYEPLAAAEQWSSRGHPPGNTISSRFPRHEKLYRYQFRGKQVEMADAGPGHRADCRHARPCDAARC